ncbi:hypothetical protein C8Q74DRAFT_1222115 [Fomes fomentarius]|nr:hypothetical protein C8Q74DRAFT_1222115 [Fomes fomentarius]
MRGSVISKALRLRTIRRRSGLLKPAGRSIRSEAKLPVAVKALRATVTWSPRPRRPSWLAMLKLHSPTISTSEFSRRCASATISHEGIKKQLIKRLIEEQVTPGTLKPIVPADAQTASANLTPVPKYRARVVGTSPLVSLPPTPTIAAPAHSSTILGRQTLKYIHDRMPHTQLPSWVNPVPADVGKKARGKLSADQWHMFCVIYLPIILIRCGIRKEIDSRRSSTTIWISSRRSFIVGSLLEMSQETIELYKVVSLQYLQRIWKLYPDSDITPNQHNSIHIVFFLCLYGPLYSIWTFFSQRMNYLLQGMNTNMKVGELESTYMKDNSRSANLRLLLEDESIHESAQELAEAVQEARSLHSVFVAI